MKLKTIIIMSLLLAVCVGFIAIHEYFKGQAERQGQNEPVVQSRPLFDKPLPDVTKLVIAPAGGSPMSFVKEGGRWRLTQPTAARASEMAVNKVIETVQNLRSARDFTPGANGGAGDDLTGLDKPAFVVTLTDASGTARTLRIGKAVPFTFPAQTYARPDGKAATYAVEADFARVLNAAPKEYRDKTVLSVPTEQVVRLSVVGEPSFEIQKIGNDWSLIKPVFAAADQAKVSTMIGRLSNVTAERFVSDNPTSLAMYDLEPGKERLVVRIGAQPPAPASMPATASSPATASAPASTSAPAMKEYALAIGKNVDGKVYAKLLDEPGVFTIEPALVEVLQPKLADLRDRKILRFAPSDVIAIEIQIGAMNAKIAQADGKWYLVKPVAGAAAYPAVDKLLKSLSDLQAADFPESQQSPSLLGLEPPKGKITLDLKGVAKPLGLLLGSTSKTGEMTFVAPLGSTTPAVVKSSDVAPLLAEPASYYDPQLLTLRRTNVQEIEVARKDGTFVLQREKDKWLLAAPEKGDADPESADGILGQLAILSATKLVSVGPSVPDKYAKAADPIVVKVTMAAPASASAPATASAPTSSATQAAPAALPPTVLHVVKIDNSAYAWIDGQPNNPVGEFSAGLYDVLASELRSRTTWTFKPEDVTALKIVTPKETVDLKKDQDKWVLTGDPYVKIDSQKVQSYLVELQALKAERFLSTRSDDAEKYNLKDAAMKVELATAAGKPLTLTVAKGDEKATSRPAASSEVKGVFELPATTIDRLVKTWKDFQQSEAPPATPPGGRPRGPGGPGMVPMPIPGDE